MSSNQVEVACRFYGSQNYVQSHYMHNYKKDNFFDQPGSYFLFYYYPEITFPQNSGIITVQYDLNQLWFISMNKEAWILLDCGIVKDGQCCYNSYSTYSSFFSVTVASNQYLSITFDSDIVQNSQFRFRCTSKNGPVFWTHLVYTRIVSQSTNINCQSLIQTTALHSSTHQFDKSATWFTILAFRGFDFAQTSDWVNCQICNYSIEQGDTSVLSIDQTSGILRLNRNYKVGVFPVVLTACTCNNVCKQTPQFTVTIVCDQNTPTQFFYPSNLPQKLYQFMIGQSGTPNFTFGLFTSSASFCPVYAYEIYEYGSSFVSTNLQITMNPNSVKIACIAKNCNTTINAYYYKIKVINIALEEIWIDIDGSGVSGTIFTFQVYCDQSTSTDLVYPMNFPNKLYQFVLGQSGTPNITFDLFNTSTKYCQIVAYKIYDYEKSIVSDYLKAQVISNSVVITCIGKNCSSTSRTYDYKIKVINLALQEIWLDIDGSNPNGTKFTFQIDCNPKDIIQRKQELPTASDFPKLFQNFILNKDYVQLKLNIDFQRPPKEPIMFQLSNVFKNSNQNGCPISSYSIYKVLNVSDQKEVIKKDYQSIFALGNTDDLFVIFGFSKQLNLQIFINASNPIVTLKEEVLNIPLIQLKIENAIKQNYVNLPPYISDQDKFIKTIIDPGFDDIIKIKSPQVYDLDSFQVTTSYTSLPNYIQFDNQSGYLLIDQSKITIQLLKKQNWQDLLNCILIDDKGTSTAVQITILYKQLQIQQNFPKIESSKHDTKFIDIISKNDYAQNLQTTKELACNALSISQQGILKLKFNSTVQYRDYYNQTNFKNLSEFLNNKTLQIYVNPAKNRHLDPELNYHEGDVNLTWKIDQFDGQNFDINIFFQNPLGISPLSVQDELIIHFAYNTIDYIYSPVLGKSLNIIYQTLSIKVMKQLPQSTATNNLVKSTSFLSSLMTGIMIVGTLIGFLIQGRRTKSFFKNLTRNLQLLFHLQLFNIQQPANTIFYNLALVSIINFDILDQLKPWEQFGLKYDKQADVQALTIYSQQWQDLGYDTVNFLKNSSTASVFLVYYFFKLKVLFVLYLAATKFQNLKLVRFVRKKLRTSFFGEILGFFLESFIQLTVAGFMSVKANLAQENGDILGIIFSYISLFIIVLFIPTLSFAIVFTIKEKLEKSRFQKKFNELYEGIRFQFMTSRAFSLIFILRRFIFCGTAFGTARSILQILILVYSNLASSVYIGFIQPSNRQLERKVDKINEILTSFASYHLLIFTDWVNDEHIKYQVGWSFLIFIYQIVLVNMGLTLYFGSKELHYLFKKQTPGLQKSFKSLKQKIPLLCKKSENIQVIQQKQMKKCIIQNENDLLKKPSQKHKKSMFQKITMFKENFQTQIQSQLFKQQLKKKFDQHQQQSQKTQLTRRQNKAQQYIQKGIVQDKIYQNEEKKLIDKFTKEQIYNMDKKLNVQSQEMKKIFKQRRGAVETMKQNDLKIAQRNQFKTYAQFQKAKELEKIVNKRLIQHYKSRLTLADLVQSEDENFITKKLVRVQNPRDKKGNDLHLNPLIALGDFCIVPRQEILDELSSDDETEMQQIALQQRHFFIADPYDKNWRKKPEYLIKFSDQFPEEVYRVMKDFHIKKTFSLDQTEANHYNRFHKNPQKKFKEMRESSKPYRVHPECFKYYMKAYKEQLFEYKFKQKIIEIEKRLYDGYRYIPKPRFIRESFWLYPEKDLPTEEVADALTETIKENPLILQGTQRLVSLYNLEVPKARERELLEQKICRGEAKNIKQFLTENQNLTFSFQIQEEYQIKQNKMNSNDISFRVNN